MLRALFLTAILAALPHGGATADTPPGLGENAALKYWQAFATLPKLSDADSQRLHADDPEAPIDASLRQVVDAAEYSLTMLHRGAALPRCEWGIGHEDGMYVRSPQVPAARVLGSLACLRARIRFEEGRQAEALDDLLAAMTLGRHLSAGGVSNDLLGGYNVEHRAIDTLARDLPRLKPSLAKTIKARLAALPPGGRPATAVPGEESLLLDWFVRRVKEAKTPAALLELLTVVDQVGRLPEKSTDPAALGRAFLEACGGNAEGVIRRAEETRPLYAMLATQLDLSLDQFAVQWKREETARANNPVFQAFFNRILRIRFQQARLDVRRAYLAAALDVRLNGRSALKRHTDPVVNEPIQDVPFPGGYELRSKLKSDEGKPVILVVGRRTNGPDRGGANRKTP
jgi:hypothetical protein